MLIDVYLVCKTVSTRQNSTRQNNTNQGRIVHDKFLIALNSFFVLYDFWGTECFFSILDNLYARQKVVMWFGEGQKY